MGRRAQRTRSPLVTPDRGVVPPPAGARAPLPTRPQATPPLDAAFGDALDAALAALGLMLMPGVRAGIEAHVRLLLAWNAAINLTAIRAPHAIALEHVADALSAVSVVRRLTLHEQPALLDLGSGAGFPGLPLGLALGVGRLTLVDSVAKKSRFLQAAGSAAVAAQKAAGEAAPRLLVCADRAESLARLDDHRGRYDLVTARAVGPLAELAELALPLLRPGGRLIAWKRDLEAAAGDSALGHELADADRLLPLLGGRLEDHRLVIVQAVRPIPSLYPRTPTERRRDRR